MEVVMMARLHAMYQRSRVMLVFLIIIYLAVNIARESIAAIGIRYNAWGELILSGTYMCNYRYEDTQLLVLMVWMLNTIWEVLALCLSIWIAAKHFRDLRRLGLSMGSTVGDCLRVLIKSHVLYFASFVGVSCLQPAELSPKFMNSDSMGAQMLRGASETFLSMQLFVLGPRLILSVRQNHAKIVANFSAGADMDSMVFQERVHLSTNSTV
ncbi:hypothetical protein BDR07DRAFT_1476940 [Suillus spraguei]|nr:hypothetical protein BDR07DRAFT_1476940 [Suillus spraguei]